MSAEREFPEWMCDTLTAMGTALGVYMGITFPNRAHPFRTALFAFAWMALWFWLIRVGHRIASRSVAGDPR